MNIQTIFDTLSGNIQAGQVELSDAALGLTGRRLGDFFQNQWGKTALVISRADCGLERETVILTGQTNLDGITAEVTFGFRVARDMLSASFDFTLPPDHERLFDYFGETVFHAVRVAEKHILPANENQSPDFYIQGDVQGDLKLGELVGILLAEDFSFLPATAIHNPRISYGRQQRLGHWRRSAGFTSSAEFRLTDKLAVSGLGVQTGCDDDLAAPKDIDTMSLAFSGTTKLGGLSLPLAVRYDRQGFWAGLDLSGKPVKIPTLDAVAQLAGVDISPVLPEKFRSLGDPELIQFMLHLDRSMARLISFSMAVQTTSPWEFLGIPKLTLSGINADFAVMGRSGGDVLVGSIAGRVDIGPLGVIIHAKKSGPGNDYEFGGRLPENLELKELVSDISVMLGLGLYKPPIPNIVIARAGVTFATANKEFSAQLEVGVQALPDPDIVSRLLNVRATVEVKSALEAGRRTLFGRFAGELKIDAHVFLVEYVFSSVRPGESGAFDDNRITASWSGTTPLSLMSLIRAFGVQNIPVDLEVLDITLDSAKLVCDIAAKRLECAVGGNFGNFTFSIYTDASGVQYVVGLEVANEIGLSSLPVVGTGLHFLDLARLRGLRFNVASKDDAKTAVKAGVTIQGVVVLGESENEFKLEAGGQSNVATDGNTDGLVKWFDIEKSLAVFELHRLGLTYRAGRLGFLLDAALAANPVRIELMQLGLGVGLAPPRDVVFYLSGLGLHFKNDQLEIGGAFMQSDGGYDGQISVRAKSFSLFASGSYQDGSLFVYGVVSLPLGGPPAFFVTGFAAGFGYNRELLLPDIDQVNAYPLVQAAFGKLPPGELLAAMKKYVVPSTGQHFGAAGIAFNSFRMADSFALLTVGFSKYLEIGLLGLSEINVPAGNAPGVNPIAHAQLALRALYSPRVGLLSIQAQLTDESYILSRDCRLSGGFAFFLWFDGDRSGDFVISLGGYSRNYRKPAHYPDVPRLGFHWKITPQLSLSGELYFALTPSRLMAGGMLAAVFQSGELRAWFTARVDVDIGWKPFSYSIDLYIGLGASYRMFLLFGYVTFKLELSVSLSLWGPEFSGIARISWFIISFSISFIKSPRNSQTINWDQFAESFLPHPADASLGPPGNAALLTVGINFLGGVFAENADANGRYLIVDPDMLSIEVAAAVPFTSLSLDGAGQKMTPASLGVLPMGEGRELASDVQVTVDGPARPGAESYFSGQVGYTGVPRAMWGLERNTGDELIPGAATRFRFATKTVPQFPSLPPVDFLNLCDLIEYGKVMRDFAWNQPPPIVGPAYPQKDTVRKMAETVMDASAIGKRKSLLEELANYGFQFEHDIKLSRLAENAEDAFHSDLVLESLV